MGLLANPLHVVPHGMVGCLTSVHAPVSCSSCCSRAPKPMLVTQHCSHATTAPDMHDSNMHVATDTRMAVTSLQQQHMHVHSTCPSGGLHWITCTRSIQYGMIPINVGISNRVSNMPSQMTESNKALYHAC
jgi:hypothetical protein